MFDAVPSILLYLHSALILTQVELDQIRHKFPINHRACPTACVKVRGS